jgi:hypothetical protein
MKAKCGGRSPGFTIPDEDEPADTGTWITGITLGP